MAKRQLVWARQTQSIALTAAADAECIDPLFAWRGLTGITANLPGMTVARAHIELFCAGQAATPTFFGLRKMAMNEIAESQADAAYALSGAPHISVGADWFAWKACYPNHGADPVSGVPNACTYEIDVRSMRRLDEFQESIGMWVSKQLSAAGHTVQLTSSLLLALP